MVLAVCGLTGTAHAQLVNGSFETASPGYTAPTGSGSASLANGSTAILGWTVFGGSSSDGLAWLGSGAYGVTTPYGNDFLDLTGYQDTSPYFGVEQTVTTIVGDTYSLGFALGVDQSSSIYNGPISVTVDVGSSQSSSFSVNPAGTGNIWTVEADTFTATSTSTLISFQGLSGDQYIGLDDVSLTDNGVSATPLPAALPMFAGGLGLVGFLARRKKRKTAA